MFRAARIGTLLGGGSHAALSLFSAVYTPFLNKQGVVLNRLSDAESEQNATKQKRAAVRAFI